MVFYCFIFIFIEFLLSFYFLNLGFKLNAIINMTFATTQLHSVYFVIEKHSCAQKQKKTLSKGFPFSSGFKISSLTSFLLKRNGFSRTGKSELSILNITRKVHVYLYTENCSLQMFLKLIFSFGSDFFLLAADEKQ